MRLVALELSCPQCGEAFTGHAADSVNAGRMPAARELILAGTFQVETCPACAERITIDRPLVYVDFDRRHFVHVFCTVDVGDWQRREQIASETFWAGFQRAPAAIHQLARSCAVRAVFGLARLAEKLRIWDAGLDDALVELLKLELVTGTRGLERARDLEVLLQRGADDQTLELLVRRRGAPASAEVTVYGVDRSRYDALARHRDELIDRWPGLFSFPYVDYRRLAREPALGEPGRAP